MLEDVLLGAVASARARRHSGRHPRARGLARRRRAETVPEPEERRSYTAAVLRATEVLGLRGTPAMLVIPAPPRPFAR